MRIQLLAVTDRPRACFEQAAADYAARLPRSYRFTETALRPARREGRGAADRLDDEAERIGKKLPPGAQVVVLERSGTALDSDAFAARLERWLAAGRDLTFVIGGPDGLAAALVEAADFRWSMSPLTFPHQLCRVLVLEQLYRASTILAGHPYHCGH